MNKGFSLASGDIIGTLNSDDVYADNKVLENVANAFTDKSVDACYGDLVYVEKYNLYKNVRYWKSCEYKDGLLQKGWLPPHPTFFARKSVYENFGGFDLDYDLAADSELMVRLIGKYKINLIYIPKLFVKMRLGGVTNKSIKNIIKHGQKIIDEDKIYAVIGGFHEEWNPFEVVKEKVKFFESLKPEIICGMHCTGFTFNKLMSDHPAHTLGIVGTEFHL